MDTREVKVIDGSGKNGLPGQYNWTTKPVEAPYGQRGGNGQSAAAPTAGQPASDIRIRLTYSNQDSDTVQVTGEGPYIGHRWKIARDEKLSLNVKGGDGGAGGRGENGQAGGRGRDGTNATKYSDGGNGENGAQGGSAGHGSNGADGAAAGNIFITVHDDDTDLLIPLEFDVRGGAGGASGQHGEPGDGGIGGRGGASHAWTQRNGDSASAYTRSGGTNGSNGLPGARPSTYLTGGKAGPQGSIQIKVIRGDLSEATYPSPYSLQVAKFDVIDENEDGINEPGEHIIVHNIRVRNDGGMPSPGSKSIYLLIQGTRFLEPITSEPVELPHSIQAGQEVDVPGVLRAHIRNEWLEKPLGAALRYVDNIQLLATFHERLKRPIPKFCGSTQIVIRNPLRLDPPTYLDCVGKGDRVRIMWVLHNDSKKSYGVEGILGRAVATKLSDPDRFFTLTYAAEDKPAEATDELPEIEPNSKITIDQDFSVDDKAVEFSEGYLTLDLMLSDPVNGKMRSIQKHQMHMQISDVYSLSPCPSYLLVINSKTPNHAIHQIISLIRHRLHIHLDIFNLSLTGSYESPITKENVLESYAGKSVIIFGNNFPYFNQGNKDPWSLLDPWHTGLLTKGGTNILFAAVSDLEGLKLWAGNAIFPAHDFTAGAHSVNDENVDNLLTKLRRGSSTPLTSDMAVHRFPVKRGMFGTVQSSVDSAADSVVKKLNKNFPLRRFIAVPDMEACKEAKRTGGVIVCEGVPKNSKMIALIELFPQLGPGTNVISDYHMYFIISCLPLAVKVRMFWNMIGKSDATGIACDTIYSGLENLYYGPPNELPSQTQVEDRILQALCISLQFELSSEIYYIATTKPRFPDPLNMSETLGHLPLFTQFFSKPPKKAQVDDIAKAQFLVTTLGVIHATSNPIGPWQTLKDAFAFPGNRKGQLTSTVNKQINAVITGSCSANVAGTVKEHVLQRSKQVKVGIKAIKGHKSFTTFGMQELAAFIHVQAVDRFDLTELQPVSVALNSAALQSSQEGYRVHRQSMMQMEKASKKMLVDMVNPVDENSQ